MQFSEEQIRRMRERAANVGCWKTIIGTRPYAIRPVVTSPVSRRVMFDTAMRWTAKWTASLPFGSEDSRAGLLSISRSKRMVLVDAIDGIEWRQDKRSPFKTVK